MDTGFDENETEFGVFVLAVSLEVLANRDSLLDKVPEILRDGWCKTVGLQDTENLVTRHETDLGNTMTIPKGNTNLGRCKTLARKLAYVVDNIVRGGL